MKKHYFTLIELLVVIAVFITLASLISPSLRKIVAKSNDLHCQTNLKTIISTAHLYMDDNNGYLPHYQLYYKANGKYGIWYRDSVAPYYESEQVKKQTHRCPTSIEKWSGYLPNKPSNTYAINRRVSCDVDIKDIRDFNVMNEAVRPSETVAFLDSLEYYVRIGGPVARFKPFAIGGGSSYEDRDMNHNYGLNTVFIDGHIEYVSALEFYNHSTSTSVFWNPLL